MPHLLPEQFGKSAAAWHDGFFEFRVGTTDSIEHLRAVQRHEHQRRGETRTDRIAFVNERIAEVESRE